MKKYLDMDGLAQLWAKIKGIIPAKVSDLVNDAGYLTQHQDISGKYDKTGGEISGDVKVGGNLTLNIEDEDYDAGITLKQSLDTNAGTVLTLDGYANGTEATNYKPVIRHVGSPLLDYDAVNKKYVDDKVATVWITGFLDDTGLLLGSGAYDTSYDGVTSNKQCYIKITEATRVRIFKLKTWKNFNEHNAGNDEFLYEELNDTNVSAVIGVKKNENIYTEVSLEKTSRKTNDVESNSTSEVLYPSCKGAYDNDRATLQEMKNWVNDQYGAHVVWEVGLDNALEATETKARTTGWQLENLDMTAYKYVLVYVQACKGTNNDQEGASVCIRINLDEKSITPRSNRYVGGTASIYPNDNGVKYLLSAVVDDTKTKFAFNYCMANTTGTTALDRDGKCYKIEGYKN